MKLCKPNGKPVKLADTMRYWAKCLPEYKEQYPNTWEKIFENHVKGVLVNLIRNSYLEYNQ